ncbi:DUF4148 domain-containing protein [Burkholderia gladioli]|uniref:DUF4148 domain-containing protein n=1 Tax=Burkholderia gladioli TaxID=28095 RepID=UPI000F7FBC47|nr:DUF4148 domain-containing protein [Burkholderia gladioli]MBU9325912.1 DUF4148 domain-containing protein [Burkholderia gladioli]
MKHRIAASALFVAFAAALAAPAMAAGQVTGSFGDSVATASAAPLASPGSDTAATRQASNGPLTRAQVRAELAQIVAAGYSPSRPNDPYYPDNVQAALKRVQDMKMASNDAAASSYGADMPAIAESGSRVVITRVVERSVYYGH